MLEEFTLSQVRQALNYIAPEDVSNFDDYFKFQASAKSAGLDYSEIDGILRQSPNYDAAENLKHWNSTKENGGVPGDYIVKLAFTHGYRTNNMNNTNKQHTTNTYSYQQNDNTTDLKIALEDFFNEVKPIERNTATNEEQLIAYLDANFNDDENICFVVQSFSKAKKDGQVKCVPANGGQTVQKKAAVDEIRKVGIEEAFKGYSHDGGVWIRSNPMQENGTTGAQVTDYRHVLIESDEMSIDEQIAFYYSSNLPISTITLSGGKSAHALVKVNAKNRKEYDTQVRKLYDVLDGLGFKVDEANKDPGRLTRAPGFKRGEQQQTLMAVNIGCSNLNEWYEYIEGINLTKQFGDLEIAENFDDFTQQYDWLIDGVYQKQEIVEILGQSKAGKSFVTMDQAIHVACGLDWYGHKVTQTNVIYCNFEIAAKMAQQRRNAIALNLNLTPENLHGFMLWNLSGKLGDGKTDNFLKLLTIKAKQTKTGLIVIDPFYELEESGQDENDAVAVKSIFTKLKQVRDETEATIIVVHHISSKLQDLRGYSLDSLAQGSSTFAREYDSMMALQELDIDALLDRPWMCMAKRAFRLSYSSRNAEPTEPDCLWATQPRYSNENTDVLKHCSLISTETLKTREKKRLDGLESALINADAKQFNEAQKAATMRIVEAQKAAQEFENDGAAIL